MKNKTKKIKEYVGRKYEDELYWGLSEGKEIKDYVFRKSLEEEQNHKIEHINSLGFDECRNLLIQILNGEETLINNGGFRDDYFRKRHREFPFVDRDYIKEKEDEIGNNIPNEIIEKEEYNAKVLDWYENEDFGVERKLTQRQYDTEPQDYTDERIYSKFVRLLKKYGKGESFIDMVFYLYEHRKELL